MTSTLEQPTVETPAEPASLGSDFREFLVTVDQLAAGAIGTVFSALSLAWFACGIGYGHDLGDVVGAVVTALSAVGFAAYLFVAIQNVGAER